MVEDGAFLQYLHVFSWMRQQRWQVRVFLYPDNIEAVFCYRARIGKLLKDFLP